MQLLVLSVVCVCVRVCFIIVYYKSILENKTFSIFAVICIFCNICSLCVVTEAKINYASIHILLGFLRLIILLAASGL